MSFSGQVYSVENIFESTNATLNNVEQMFQSSVKDLSSKGGNLSPTDLVMVQKYLQTESALIQTQSTMLKVIADTAKSVIQNMGS